MLLGFGADAGVQDSDGQLCITAMVAKMTPVVSVKAISKNILGLINIHNLYVCFYLFQSSLLYLETTFY